MPPVTYAQLLANGWTRHGLQQALTRGTVTRLARGWYDVGGCTSDELTALAAGGRIGCLTGLRNHGVWVPPTQHPHLVLPRWCPSAAAATVHALPRDGVWAEAAVTYDLIECLRQALRHHGAETSLIVLESACNLGLVGEWTARGLIAECPPRKADRLSWFDPRAESGTETRVRVFLQRRGYRVRPQVQIEGVGRVDLLVGESLIIECDSRAHHTGETTYRVDRARDLRAAAADLRVLRLTWEQCFLSWPATTNLLLAHLQRRQYLRPPAAG